MRGARVGRALSEQAGAASSFYSESPEVRLTTEPRLPPPTGLNWAPLWVRCCPRCWGTLADALEKAPALPSWGVRSGQGDG